MSTYLAGDDVLLLVDKATLGGSSGTFRDVATYRILAVILGELPSELAVTSSSFDFHGLSFANHVYCARNLMVLVDALRLLILGFLL